MFNVIDEGIKNPEKYLKSESISKSDVQNWIEYVIKKIDQNLSIFTHKFPSPASKNLIYEPVENKDWTASFFTGMLWLAYEMTGDEKYKKIAEIHIDSFRERFEKSIRIDTHDLGFLYSLSCVSAYKLTKNDFAKELAIKAAEHLSKRYYPNAKIIQAWGKMDDNEQKGRIIIDCLMNLPLLYWTSEEKKDRVFFEIAYSHATKTAENIVRSDASTYHTFYFDTETGKPLYGKTHQGYSDDSCWSRGQAWGIYGFTLSYLYSKDESFLELAKRLANYFLNRLPEDYIPYWDLIFTSGDEPRDSSAAAIALCGLLELVRILPLTDSYREFYENAAKNIVYSLSNNYISNSTNSNGILLHAVYSKPGGNGVDEHCIWGDYFYFEALVRLYKSWQMYW